MFREIYKVVAGCSLVSVGVAYGQVTVNTLGDNGVSFGSYSRPAWRSIHSELGFPELLEATTYTTTVTTPDDILAVDFSIDVVAGSVFHDNVTLNSYGSILGRNTGPSAALLAAISIRRTGALFEDSWVSTPGSNTQCAEIGGACPGFENVDDAVVDHVSHFDSSGEGAQTDFNFARITLVPDERGAMAEFTGFVHVANQASPIVEPFSFTLGSVVPEPGSMSLVMMALLGGLAFVRTRRDV